MWQLNTRSGGTREYKEHSPYQKSKLNLRSRPAWGAWIETNKAMDTT